MRLHGKKLQNATNLSAREQWLNAEERLHLLTFRIKGAELCGTLDKLCYI